MANEVYIAAANIGLIQYETLTEPVLLGGVLELQEISGKMAKKLIGGSLFAADYLTMVNNLDWAQKPPLQTVAGVVMYSPGVKVDIETDESMPNGLIVVVF